MLSADARMPNNALAEAVGIAPSTCLNRIRQLREAGIIRGFHADVDPAALGRPLRAMISVRLQAGARHQMPAFLDRIRRRPEVMDVYFLGGADDFLVNIAAADTAAVREFVVDALSAHPEVAHTETNLVFEHYRSTPRRLTRGAARAAPDGEWPRSRLAPMPAPDGLDLARARLRADDAHPAAIAAFERAYAQLAAGETGVLAEADLEPVDHLEKLSELDFDESSAREALARTAVIKLNGGLGTSMGMDRAKSLLPVHDGLTFLDVIARQILALREQFGVDLPLLLMNSFRTSADTMAALQAYPELPVDGLDLEFLQNREPKVRVDDLTPVDWPADPSLEWCPPGHGDLYAALVGSGALNALIERGYRYAFVSNSDNLGARPEPRLAAWFAGTGAPFGAEYCRRTAADRKGGHLARRRSDGGLVLRESAQTAPEDMAAFQNITRHRFFNSNSLWLDLPALRPPWPRTEGCCPCRSSATSRRSTPPTARRPRSSRSKPPWARRSRFSRARQPSRSSAPASWPSRPPTTCWSSGPTPTSSPIGRSSGSFRRGPTPPWSPWTRPTN